MNHIPAYWGRRNRGGSKNPPHRDQSTTRCSGLVFGLREKGDRGLLSRRRIYGERRAKEMDDAISRRTDVASSQVQG